MLYWMRNIQIVFPELICLPHFTDFRILQQRRSLCNTPYKPSARQQKGALEIGAPDGMTFLGKCRLPDILEL